MERDLPSRSSRAVVTGSAHPLAPQAETFYLTESSPGGISFRGILGVVRRHVWLILLVAAVPIAAAGYLVYREVPLYSAMAVIRILDKGGSMTSAPSGGSPKTSDPIMSEIMVLEGRSVLGETVDREGLRLFSASSYAPAGMVEDVEVTLPPDRSGTIRLEFGPRQVAYGSGENRRKVPYGEPIVLDGARFVVPAPPGVESATLVVIPRDRAIDYLVGAIGAQPRRGTDVVDVSFTAIEPRVATRVVNAVVRVYQEVNAETARQELRRRRAFLEEQLGRTDSLLTSAQADLSGLRSREQAYSAQEKFAAAQGNLVHIEMQQAELQANLRMYESLLNQILESRRAGQSGNLSALMTMPGIAGDPVVSQLYSQLAGYQAARDSMVTGPWARARTHPDVTRLETLIASTEQRLIDAVRTYTTSLRAQIAALGGIRGQAVAKMSDLPETEVQEMWLTKNLGALERTGDQLREQYQAVRLEEAAEAGQVEIVQLASRARPLGSNAGLKLLLGLVTGLMLAGGAAFAREKMDDSIKRPEEIEEMLLVPNLAVIPETTPSALDGSGLVKNGDAPARRLAGKKGSTLPPLGAEAYRILRTNLLFSQSERGLKTLVVTSAAPGEGKTMTAANLAVAYAQQGFRVLLMECDLRRPSLGRYFESPNGADLTSVLLDNRDWREAISSTGIDGLDVLLAGRSFPRAAEVLAGPVLKRLLGELSRWYDMVILDTSPLLVAADATILGAIADGVLLVVRATHTDRPAVQRAVQQLDLVGARVVGTVLNDPDGAVGRYGSYYDYSGAYETENHTE